jgi:hypothetical protein
MTMTAIEALKSAADSLHFAATNQSVEKSADNKAACDRHLQTIHSVIAALTASAEPVGNATFCQKEDLGDGVWRDVAPEELPSLTATADGYVCKNSGGYSSFSPETTVSILKNSEQFGFYAVPTNPTILALQKDGVTLNLDVKDGQFTVEVEGGELSTAASLFFDWLKTIRINGQNFLEMKGLNATPDHDTVPVRRIAPADVYVVLKEWSDRGSLDADHLSALSRDIAAHLSQALQVKP